MKAYRIWLCIVVVCLSGCGLRVQAQHFPEVLADSQRFIYLPVMAVPRNVAGLLDDFEGDEVGVGHWLPYGSGLTCAQVAPGYRSEHALRMDLAIAAGTYAGCGRPFDATGWATAEGLRLTWRSDTPGLTFSVALLLPDTFYASHFVTGGSTWETVYLPWSSFLKGDGSNTPFSVSDLPSVTGINFDVGNGQVSQHGTIWIDDLRLAAVAAPAHAYYVSPQGDDAWSGRLASPNADGTDGPFRTLARARDAVRARLGFQQARDIEVFLREGTYRQSATLEFTAQDSGRDGYRVVYRNYPGERPVVSGGQELTGWQYYRDGIYTTQVDWAFYTLYENDVRGVMARHPNQDLSNGRPSGNEYMQTAGQVPGREWDAFKFDPATFPAMQDTANLEVLLWNGGPDGYFHWWTNTGPVTNVSYASEMVELGFQRDPYYQLHTEIGPGTDYFIQNSLDLLDTPGEFYIQGNTLYYWPRQPMDGARPIIAPRLQQIFRLADDPELVHDLAFEGLTIRDTERGIESWPGYQSSTAFLVNKAENIEIRGNHIFNVGGYGVLLHGNHVQNVTIENNLLHNTGRTAVIFNGYPDPDTGVNAHQSNAVVNNYIHTVGEVIGFGNGVRILGSSDNLVAHNLMHTMPAEGINMGGNSTLETPQAWGNTVAFNDIHDVTLDLEDMGPIYMAGTGPNTLVHNNHFHNTNVDFAYGFGVYMDEATNDTTIRSNVLEEIQRPPDQEGYIWGLIAAGDVETHIENNIMTRNEMPYGGIILPRETNYDAPGAPISGPDDTPDNNIDVLRNIFYNNHGPLYNFRFDHPDHRLRQVDYNLFYNTEDRYLILGLAGADTLAEWQTLDGYKYDQHSLVADPLFVDAEGGDYRLRFDSPAYGQGFEDINFVDMGLRVDFPFSDPNDPLARLFVTSDRGGHGATLALSTGQQAQLTPTARTEVGYVADLSAASVTYASENAAVATVDAAGRVTAQGYGATRVNVTVSRGGRVLSLPVFVLVNIDPAAASGLLPPPVDPPPPVPTFLSPLWESDYDDQFMAFKSTMYARWHIVEENGNAIYCSPALPGRDFVGSMSMFGSPYWKDYAVSMWVRFGPATQGSVTLRTRFDITTWWGYAHTLDLASGYASGVWHHLRAEADGNTLRTFINGQLVFSQVTDPADRDWGHVGLGIYPDVTVCVDDVVVRSLDRSPEAMAGAVQASVTQDTSIYLWADFQAPTTGALFVGNVVYLMGWSADGNWAYVRNDVMATQGWVPANCVALQ